MNNIVKTNHGMVEGIVYDKGLKFLGIPFAKAPIGNLTFKNADMDFSWEGIYKANIPKSNPIQREGTFSVSNNSLDCLYLNIFVPKTVKDNTKLPVMVWIYGGSYATGGAGLKDKNSGSIEYDCSDFANDVNCVVVTFNYRLNLYGYLNLNAFCKEFDLNNGISDQIAALKFIKENINNFYGDSENITLFGQSAGGASIIALMSIDEIKNLFNKAIVMSPVSEHFFSHKESKKIASKFLKYSKIKKKEFNRIFTLPEENIKILNKKIAKYAYRKGELRCPFSPTYGNNLLKDQPKILVKKCDKPLLIGNVKNEGNLFLLDIPDIALPFMVKLFRLRVKRNKNETYRYRASIALTHKIYKDPIMEIINNYAGNVYKYEYQYVSPDCAKLGIETFHACDVPVLFGYNTNFEKVDDEETKRVGHEMRKLFSKFAYGDFQEFSDYRTNKKEIIIK